MVALQDAGKMKKFGQPGSLDIGRIMIGQNSEKPTRN